MMMMDDDEDQDQVDEEAMIKVFQQQCGRWRHPLRHHLFQKLQKPPEVRYRRGFGRERGGGWGKRLSPPQSESCHFQGRAPNTKDFTLQLNI